MKAIGDTSDERWILMKKIQKRLSQRLNSIAGQNPWKNNNFVSFFSFAASELPPPVNRSPHPTHLNTCWHVTPHLSRSRRAGKRKLPPKIQNEVIF
jgi:hypothetical protein